jgi:signal peptide peptidase SppA
MNLHFLDQMVWLADPAQVQLHVYRALRVQGCPTARQLAKARQKRLDAARHCATRAAVRATGGKVGVVAVHGPITQRYSVATEKTGGVSCEEVSAALDVLSSDPAVKAVILHVDSPGGESYGVEELADKLYDLRDKKPCYAIADSMACSAAYWIASACSTFCCTPGGDVGSVGVYAVHLDQSAALEQEGMKVTLVHAGKYKTEGNPFEALDKEGAAYMQSMVDATYARFCKGLARNRGCSLDDVRKNFGQGRVVNAADALKCKMIDKVCTFEELLGKLTSGGGSAVGGQRASMDVLRMRHALNKSRAARPAQNAR